MKTFIKQIAGTAFVFLLACPSLFSQAQISGVIHSADGKPLPFANVLLLAAVDSSLIKGEISGDDGSFVFTGIPANEYRLLLSMVGYAELYSNALPLSTNQHLSLEPYTLLENVAQLNAVTVTARRPLFEQKIDRMTVNVSNSITSAGATALEVLERSPGVRVNRQQGGISMLGKEGVVVMINGKINRMPLSAVVEFLDGMPSGNIEKIELITTPPANFDAEGNAGFINIVLKQTASQGLNASFTLSAGYGKGEVGNAVTNFNYRRGIFNVYGDYAYNRDARYQESLTGRLVDYENVRTETLSKSERDPLQSNHTGRLGLDVQLSKKTVIGALFSSYDTKWTMDAGNRATYTKNGQLDAAVVVQNQELNQWRHYGGNFNIQHQFREGETLTFDADYLYYKDNNPNDYVNTYSDGTGNFVLEELTHSGKITPLNISVGKLDYAKSFGKKWQLETGLKAANSNFTNDVLVENNAGQGWVEDPDLTAKYKLDEKILAAYSALDVQLDKKTKLKLGLRYEFTDSNLGSEEAANIVDREYGRLFPSFFVSREFNEKNSANFSYVRRITRPTFNDMAPFVIFLDPHTFFSGNAALQPAISNAVKLDYRFSTILLSLQYTAEDSTIAGFQTRVDPATNRQIYFADNLKDQQTTSLALSFPVNPAKWWSMQFNVTGIYTKLRSYYEGNLLTYDQKSLNLFASQTFTLPKDFTFEVSGFYNSKSLSGAYTFKPFGALNAGLQKKLPNDAGALRLGYDNILNTMVWKSELSLPNEGLFLYDEWTFFRPTVKLTYTRSFGNKTLKGKRERQMGSEEERGRVN